MARVTQLEELVESLSIVHVHAEVTQQVNINVFKNENTKHIGHGEVREILESAIKETKDPAQQALRALISAAILIYSDPHHPENITCYLPNKNPMTDEAMVHTSEGWSLLPVQLVSSPMIKRTLDTIVELQPFEEAATFADLMRSLIENEDAYHAGKNMRTILVRNGFLMDKMLAHMGDQKKPTTVVNNMADNCCL